MLQLAAFLFWLLLGAIAATVPIWLISLWLTIMPDSMVAFGGSGAMWAVGSFVVIFFATAAILFEYFDPGDDQLGIEFHMAPMRWLKSRPPGARARPLILAMVVLAVNVAGLALFVQAGPWARFKTVRTAEAAEARRLAEIARWPEQRLALAETALAAAGRCRAGEDAPLERFSPGLYIPYFDYEAGVERKTYRRFYPGREPERDRPTGFTLVPDEIATIVHVVDRRTAFQHRYYTHQYGASVGEAYRVLLLVCLTDREGTLFHRLTFTGVPSDTARFTNPGFKVHADRRMAHMPDWIEQEMGLVPGEKTEAEEVFGTLLLIEPGWPEARD